MFNADGTPKMTRYPGDFYYHHAALNVANIVFRGNPGLPPEWRAVTQAHRDEFEREHYGATYKEMEAA